MHLLSTIERYLNRNGVSAARVGREALGDPRFVADLRRGREPRPRTVARVIAYLDAHRPPSC